MRCVLPALNFKVLGKAAVTLNKISEELYLEASIEGLKFLSVNSSKSAFVFFTFNRNFFSHLSAKRKDDASSSENEISIKYKLSAKSILSVFRTPCTIVESCEIMCEPNSELIVIQLHCKHSIKKIYHIPVIDYETISAVYNKENAPNRFCAHSKVLHDVIQNFQNDHDDISITVNSTHVYFRNFYESSSDARKVAVRTEIGLEALEFDSLDVNSNCTTTFNIHDLKALLFFSEATCVPITAFFGSLGKPIVFNLSNSSAFEANFVFATLYPETTGNSFAPNRTGSSGQDVSAQSSVWLKAQKDFYPRCFMQSGQENAIKLNPVFCVDSDSES